MYWFAMFVLFLRVFLDRMVGLNDSRREDPSNFRLLLGASNLQDLTGVQIVGIDLIVKVMNDIDFVISIADNRIRIERFTVYVCTSAKTVF